MQNATRARDLVGLGQATVTLTTGRVDGSEMYRSAVVLAVAALDSYVHGIVIDRSVDIILGKLPSGSFDRKIGLHFKAVFHIVSAASEGDMELAAKTQVAQRMSLETFQTPDDIAKALATVGIGRVWSTLFPTTAEAEKTKLSLVVRRRNAIAHQCDLDAINPSSLTPMTDFDSLYSIEVVEKLVAAIDTLV
ncbi:HEPN domain-containing protein [Rathayibacter festucae]|uniref:HEPN domain-containing protein n=1 Tax=Rathayibacter festucae TaxID=110937 RepID=UPI000FDA74A6|nr:hypothetical protein [Rathayibacter festucae]